MDKSTVLALVVPGIIVAALLLMPAGGSGLFQSKTVASLTVSVSGTMHISPLTEPKWLSSVSVDLKVHDYHDTIVMSFLVAGLDRMSEGTPLWWTAKPGFEISLLDASGNAVRKHTVTSQEVGDRERFEVSTTFENLDLGSYTISVKSSIVISDEVYIPFLSPETYVVTKAVKV